MMGMAIPKDSWKDALATAVTKAGGKTSLMRLLNARGWDIKSHNVITQWEKNGVPSKYCPDIEDETGVTCEKLCPDVRWGLVRDRRRSKCFKSSACSSSCK